MSQQWSFSDPRMKWNASFGLCGLVFYSVVAGIVTTPTVLSLAGRISEAFLIPLAVINLLFLMVLVGASGVTTQIFDEGVEIRWRFGFPKRRYRWEEIEKVRQGHYQGLACCGSPMAEERQGSTDFTSWTLIGINHTVVLTMRNGSKHVWSTYDSKRIIVIIHERVTGRAV